METEAEADSGGEEQDSERWRERNAWTGAAGKGELRGRNKSVKKDIEG